MNIFVMVDMEGISGICRRSQVSSDGAHYQSGRRYLTRDVNACVEGCFAGGAARVRVRDAHGSGFHFIWEDLDPRAEYVQGASPRERMPGIGSFQGLILLGYHAMAGTPGAILEHSWSSATVQNFWMNGEKCGELAVDAAIAGDHGIPLVMVSGDDKACLEAAGFCPGAIAVEVKKGLDVEGGIMLPAPRAHELIRDGAARAVGLCSKIKPFRVRPPVTIRREVVSRCRVPVEGGRARVIDGRTYEVTGPSVEEALRM